MIVYLSSPGNAMHADKLRGRDVLLSYPVVRKVGKWLPDYIPSFSRLLLDSGAFSEFNTGQKIELDAYADWVHEMKWSNPDAVAALDDIRGDWQKGLENWRRYPEMFPTYHSSDPPEALDVILSYGPKWIGLGMVPPRNKTAWLDEALSRIPAGIHVHGFALGAYTDRLRLDSVDSTGWWRDAQKLLVSTLTAHLTPAECVEIVLKRIERSGRKQPAKPNPEQPSLGLEFN